MSATALCSAISFSNFFIWGSSLGRSGLDLSSFICSWILCISSSVPPGGKKKILPLSIFPGGCGISFMTLLAVTLFPQPVSPTRPKVSPLYKMRLTPSMALTTPDWV